MTFQRQLVPTSSSEVQWLVGIPGVSVICLPLPLRGTAPQLRLPSNNKGLHGGLNDKMKASCVSLEDLMTFRAAVEMLGLVQTHMLQKDKETHGGMKDWMGAMCSYLPRPSVYQLFRKCRASDVIGMFSSCHAPCCHVPSHTCDCQHV